MRRFIIVGTGRSASGYIAALLRKCGVHCGHESVFGPAEGLGSPVVWNGWAGDASWLAVPRLSSIDCLVLHQVRNPLRTIRSLKGIGMLDDRPDGLSAYQQVIAAGMPSLFESEDPVRRGVRFWTEWNERCEAEATLTWRVEDLGPGLLEQVVCLVGANVSGAQLSAALAETPTNVNSRHRDETIRWPDILGRDRDHRLANAARRYGYHVPASAHDSASR